jgi:cytochrome c-type biogenesis protein CcmH/NrfG
MSCFRKLAFPQIKLVTSASQIPRVAIQPTKAKPACPDDPLHFVKNLRAALNKNATRSREGLQAGQAGMPSRRLTDAASLLSACSPR